MNKTDWHPTIEAVENELLSGMYYKHDEQTELPVVQTFPENTWKTRLKQRLKKNHLIYGCWLKYKLIRGRLVPKPSLKAKIKNVLKKSHVLCWMVYLIRIPYAVKNSEQKIDLLLQIVSFNSEKLDSLLHITSNNQRNFEPLQQSLASTGQKLDLLFDIVNNNQQNFEPLQQSITSIDQKMDPLLQSIRDVERKTNGILQKLNDAQSTMQQLCVQQNMCRTVIASPDAICVQYDWNLLIGVPSGDWRLAAYLSLGGHFEYGTELLYRKVIRSDMVVVDIGANVGIYTLHALKAGAEVYAFEPTPETFNILRHNVALNGFEYSPKVHLYNSAVSDREEMTEFAVVSNSCGHNSMFRENKDDKIIRVPTVRLDDTLDGIKIDCFKVDVEGAEMLVLNGMESLLKNNASVVGFVEFAPGNLRRSGIEPRDLYDRLNQMGFRDIRLIDETSGETYAIHDYKDICDAISVNLYIQKG